MNGSTVMNGSALTYHGAAVNVAANWQVVQIGDFNGDGSSDILWRDSGTGALSEWLMTGNVVSGATTLSANGATTNPDLSWTPQAKPTNYA
jgi:enoyl-CoA hydratase/carnithine racemase